MRIFTIPRIAAGLASSLFIAFVLTAPVLAAEDIAHGGGCRKSSPPGQCCHMDNSVGSVHCH